MRPPSGQAINLVLIQHHHGVEFGLPATVSIVCCNWAACGCSSSGTASSAATETLARLQDPASPNTPRISQASPHQARNARQSLCRQRILA